MARSRSWLWIVGGALAGLALTSSMVLRTTGAVMTGNTSTGTNSWQSGGAQLTNDYASTAVFSTATDNTLVGGQTLQKCVVVNYVGTTPAAGVRFYAQSVSGTLKDYLDVTIEAGTSTSTNGNCTGFSATSTITGGGATIGSLPTTYGSGLDTWAPTAGQSRTYRFTITVQNVQAAQNQNAQAVFAWEARTA